MNLAALLTEAHVVTEISATNHFGAIEELVVHLDERGLLQRISRETVTSALREREDKVSTGIGFGVAIPHAFVPELDEVIVVFGRSTEGVDFDSIDNVPVKLIVLFIVPEDQYHAHLETLAAIAKMLNDGETRASLLDAPDEAAILSVLGERFSG